VRHITALLSRHGPLLASLGLWVLFLFAGWSALPMRDRHPVWTFHQADQLASSGVASTQPVPVFVMRPDRSTLRVGTGIPQADGRIDALPFDPSDPRLIQASEALLFDADLRVLWLLASDEERTRIRLGMDALGRGLREAVDAVIKSPEFALDYRGELKDVAQQAVQAAWREPGTRNAYDELSRGAEPILRDAVKRDLMPIVLNRAEPLVWDMLGANAGALIDIFRTRQWDLRPVDQMMDAILRDARDHGIVEKTARRIIESRQAKSFMQVFASTVMDALARDERIRSLMVRLVTDQRIAGYLSPLTQPAAELARFAPGVLLGVHPSNDLNAIAAFTFRGFITGKSGRLVILMTPEQRDEMLRLDSRAPRLLLRNAQP
jgi:hypothetical protein